MAEMKLKPKESFEHTHSKDSYSILRQGEGILKTGGKEIKMVKDKKYKIPGGQSHTIMNNSPDDILISCVSCG